MTTIKKGSTGADVRKLQDILGITADGIFGNITESNVKKYQKSNGLVSDGIVGPKTWAKLLGENKSDDATKEIEIKKAYIYKHITPSKGRPITYIAIHYTAGGNSKQGRALATQNVFLKRNASADFVVDDKDIVQINPDLKNYYCWSVGDNKNPYSNGGRLYGKATNRNTVSIEICSNLKSGTSASAANHSGWYFTDESLDNAVKLVKYLMSKYNVPKNNVVRHYDISGKLCPGIVGWNDAKIYTTDGKSTKEDNNSDKWKKFLERI